MKLISNVSVAVTAAGGLSAGQFTATVQWTVTAAALTANDSPSGAHTASYLVGTVLICQG
jgi:hypothetical protein